MKWQFVILPVIASALWLAGRKRNASAQKPAPTPAPVPEAQDTPEQGRFAREAGCHYGQGFLSYKSISQNRVFEMIHRSSILEENV